MQLSSAPAQLVLPWGNGDSSKTNPIPVPSQQGITPGAASWTDGFPPLCATPVSSGGLPPTKADMNGGLYQMSAVDVWSCAGGGYPYSSAFSTAIGGYPKGARVLKATGLGYWLSTVDNNTSDPDTGGAGWVSMSLLQKQDGLLAQTASFTGRVLIPSTNGSPYRVFAFLRIHNASGAAISAQVQATLSYQSNGHDQVICSGSISAVGDLITGGAALTFPDNATSLNWSTFPSGFGSGDYYDVEIQITD